MIRKAKLRCRAASPNSITEGTYMTLKPTLIDYLKDKAASSPDQIFFRFVDYDDDAQTCIQEKHTYQESWHRALEIAYMLRKRGAAPRRPRGDFFHAGLRNRSCGIRMYDGRRSIHDHPAAIG
ncbi:MAG: hypothetical protein LUC83_02125 [Clostridiales bacterium]|nr:hypothetical protein [Clostridiales bacterium]